ncbi:hypothetical protein ACOSQ3_032951 [Xanthoceras sorbifolium]
MVVRDHLGAVLGSSWQRLCASLSPPIAEAVAILRGLVFAAELGVRIGVIESDAASVVKLINGDLVSNSEIGIVIHDIKRVLSNFHGAIVDFVPRLANTVTHGLAKLALVSVSDCFLVDDIPPCVESCVLADMPR